MNKAYVMIPIAVLAMLVLGYYAYYESGQFKTSPDDIHVTAVLKPNANPRLDYKDYMLDVQIAKSKSSQHMIYPYIEGLHSLTFDEREEQGYFVPTSLGSDPGDSQRVLDALREANIRIAQESALRDIIGFWSPEEAGNERMRLYLEAHDDFEPSDRMYLVYVHSEENWLGQQLHWTKLIEVTFEL